MRIECLIVISMIFASCGSSGNDKNKTADGDSTTTAAPASGTNPDKISLDRTNVSTEAVANYSQKIENPLNDWYFKVQLFETPHKFRYLIKIQYEEMNEKDTLKIPNLGIEPKLEIRKGDENYSCIIGFIDNKNQFREYKKVIAKNNTLKVTTLKHYAVYAK